MIHELHKTAIKRFIVASVYPLVYGGVAEAAVRQLSRRSWRWDRWPLGVSATPQPTAGATRALGAPSGRWGETVQCPQASMGAGRFIGQKSIARAYNLATLEVSRGVPCRRPAFDGRFPGVPGASC